MAEFAIIIVPRDPHYVPSPSAVLAAQALLADFFPDRGDEVRQKTSATPQLITTKSAPKKHRKPLDAPRRMLVVWIVIVTRLHWAV
jgi:hypothetical protein